MANVPLSGTFIQATNDAEENTRQLRDLRERYERGDETFSRRDMGLALSNLERMIAVEILKLKGELGG